MHGRGVDDPAAAAAFGWPKAKSSASRRPGAEADQRHARLARLLGEACRLPALFKPALK